MTLALYVVGIEVEPGAEDAWNRWHEDIHVPEVLREPGFLSCRKWRDTEPAKDGWARYVCHYELTELTAMQRYASSDAAKRLREESLTRFGNVTRYTRQVLTEVKRF
ncbi:DUF4286 family protein [Pyxidicoccus parkwayensis]|uniref:DUF4286 family protein n=1 Tax=Pyxidicoccus parkwayensis TaxID=2813578 RepID=A0ABX7NPD7_9BACT|nr:DUF4286 family protein [Pyxidicoccus parkwaysis]QSQ20645.1 DUF4286 family protein [Pyxidicoccus parkwaysis]